MGAIEVPPLEPADVSRQPSLEDPDTGPFWRAAADHELRYPVCDTCGTVVFYPRAHCPHCLGRELTWHRSEGRGHVYSCTTVRSSRDPAFRSLAPYVVALVDLDEGFRLLTHVVTDGAAVAIGARVTVDWQPCGETSLPVFRLVDQTADPVAASEPRGATG